MWFAGASFGDDFIIANPDLRRRDCVRVLGEMANLLRLSRKALFEILEQFPVDQKILKRRAAFLALRRIMVAHAKAVGQTCLSASEISRRMRNEDIFGKALRAASAIHGREEAHFRLLEQLEEFNTNGGVTKRLLTLEFNSARQTEMLETLLSLHGQSVTAGAPSPSAAPAPSALTSQAALPVRLAKAVTEPSMSSAARI